MTGLTDFALATLATLIMGVAASGLFWANEQRRIRQRRARLRALVNHLKTERPPC